MSKKSSKIMVIIAVVLMIISMVGASLVQTSGGKVKVEEVKFDTAFGYQLSALIYRPVTATAENKAPGIIAVHGMYNNKEMQDSNLVELSRRGYVVMAIDLFSHGDSDLLPTQDMLPMSGLAGLQYLAALPYVDTARIGMTGHSMGGLNCDIATQMGVTEAGDPLVKALFLNCCFATYVDGDGNYANIYGNRDVAILADKYDEFLFTETNADGTVLLPKDFILSDNAQSFLNFGAEPAAELRSADTMYTENIDGEDAIRVVYTPAYNHPWSHFSKTGAARTIEFFDAAIGAPVSIPSSNQIWQWKELLNFVGLVGFAMFALSFTLVLLDTKAFSALRAPAPVAARLVSKKRRVWSVSASLIVAVLGAVLYFPIVTGLKGDTNGKIIFAQNSTMALGVWAAVCGLIAMLAMFLIQRANRGDGLSAAELGICTSGKRVLLGLGLGVISVLCSYLWVIAADLIFKTDFRIWFTAAKTFTGRIFLISLFPNLIFFLIYFVANSLMVNAFGYYSDKKGNTALHMLISVLPALSIVLIQYIKLFSTGAVAFGVYGGSSAHSMILWLFPMLLFVPTAVLISRKIYQKTNDPYLPAFINACIVTFMTCANTSSWA